MPAAKETANDSYDAAQHLGAVGVHVSPPAPGQEKSHVTHETQTESSVSVLLVDLRLHGAKVSLEMGSA
jgi:hypothetical protein